MNDLVLNIDHRLLRSVTALNPFRNSLLKRTVELYHTASSQVSVIGARKAYRGLT